MNKNTIVSIVLIAGVAGAGFYLYKKMKTPAATVTVSNGNGINSALTTAGIGLGTSALGDFESWLKTPGVSNTNSTNSTSGTPDDSDSYDDTGLDDLV